MTEATAKIGHNRGPFKATSQHIAGLFDEAQHWLDGKPVTDKKQADIVVDWIHKMRAAKTVLDDNRKDEVKFWNKGKSEVQARFNPILKMCKTAIDAAQEALGPWLLTEETARRERAVLAAVTAVKAKTEADALIQASSGNPEKRLEAEYRLADAQELEKIARQLAKENIAKGARSVWDVEILDRTEAAQAIWAIAPEAFDDLLEKIAKDRVDKGAREIRGFTITERIRV